MTWYNSVKDKRFDALGVGPKVRLEGNNIKDIFPYNIISLPAPSPGSIEDQTRSLENPVAFIL